MILGLLGIKVGILNHLRNRQQCFIEGPTELAVGCAGKTSTEIGIVTRSGEANTEVFNY